MSSYPPQFDATRARMFVDRTISSSKSSISMSKGMRECWRPKKN